MIVPSAVQEKYDSVISSVEGIRDKAESPLRLFCNTNNYAFQSRIKSVESVAEKIESGRFSKWSEIDDLYAATVVVPKISDESKVSAFLEGVFDIKQFKRRGESPKPPEVFRFDSTRVICSVSPPEGMKPRPLHQIAFEVQIRSAFEHAWHAATHDLTFKGDKVDWKRMRLTAQLKATVEQLDMLVMGFEESSEFIPQSEWRETHVKKQIFDYFTLEIEHGVIPSELRPASWSRFCDNLYSLIKASKSVNKYSISDKIEYIIESISKSIHSFHTGKFPRSASLFQLVFAILATEEVIEMDAGRFTPLITEEIKMLFPGLETSNGFSFDQ